MRKLRLTARTEATNPRHTQIGVFQNGGKAGVLCVDTEHAQEVLELLNGLGHDKPIASPKELADSVCLDGARSATGESAGA